MEEGTLIQLLSGDASAIEEVQAVCKAFATNLVPIVGSASASNNQRLCFNFFAILLIEAIAECHTYAKKMGASRETMAQFFDGRRRLKSPVRP